MILPQTNLQLYAAMRAAACRDEDLALVRRAYDEAARLFAGAYRGSGKTFVAHLVGTAGVLAEVRAPAEAVAAALLHAAYSHGDFGDGHRGVTEAKRARLRAAVGPAVEALVAAYDAFAWDAAALPGLRARLPSMTETERTVVLMRLANEVDDHADLAMLYRRDARRRVAVVRESLLPHAPALAGELGQPLLRDALDEILRATLDGDVPAALRGDGTASFVVAPASYRPRAGVRLARLLGGARRP